MVSFAFLWTRYGARDGWSWVRQFGTTSLLVYWVHIELVYGRGFLVPEERPECAADHGGRGCYDPADAGDRDHQDLPPAGARVPRGYGLVVHAQDRGGIGGLTFGAAHVLASRSQEGFPGAKMSDPAGL